MKSIHNIAGLDARTAPYAPLLLRLALGALSVKLPQLHLATPTA